MLSRTIVCKHINLSGFPPPPKFHKSKKINITMCVWVSEFQLTWNSWKNVSNRYSYPCRECDLVSEVMPVRSIGGRQDMCVSWRIKSATGTPPRPQVAAWRSSSLSFSSRRRRRRSQSPPPPPTPPRSGMQVGKARSISGEWWCSCRAEGRAACRVHILVKESWPSSFLYTAFIIPRFFTKKNNKNTKITRKTRR